MPAVSAERQTFGALTSDAGVTAVVAQRVFLQAAPQNSKLPRIVYLRSASDFTSTIDDSKPVAADVTVSVVCWSQHGDEAASIADLVEVAMNDNGPPVNRQTHYDPETELHATIVDFQIWELGDTDT